MGDLGYKAGHPWFYKLGGKVQSPKEILQAVKRRDYKGCKKEHIEKANQKCEPQRSVALRKIRDEALKSLRQNLSIYRRVARELHIYRKSNPIDDQPISSCVHMSMSLKYNHLYNDFAHLVWIEDLLSIQRDLFDT